MKGQLFQIKDQWNDELLLLWCNDKFVHQDSVEKIFKEWFNTDNCSEDYDEFLELLETTDEFIRDGIVFERVYVEEIIINIPI